MADSWDTTKYYADPSQLALKLGVSVDHELMLVALELVTARFVGDIERRLELTVDDVYYGTGDGGPVLALPGAPIHGTPVVKIDGVEVTDFQVGRRTGMLRRPAGWPDILEGIEVTYTHGYAELPGDVKAAILETAEAGFNYAAGLESVGTGDENIKFAKHLIEAGSSVAWSQTVDRYFLSSNGDGV